MVGRRETVSRAFAGTFYRMALTNPEESAHSAAGAFDVKQRPHRDHYFRAGS